MVKAKPSVVQVGFMAAAAYCVMAGFIVLLVEWRSLPAIQPVLDELRSSVAGLLKIAILGWALKVWWEWRTRRQRLRFAIKVEVRTTLRNFKRIFTQANKDDLVRTLGREQRYIVTIIASPRFAIMSNLDDSISYLSPRLCRFVIA